LKATQTTLEPPQRRWDPRRHPLSLRLAEGQLERRLALAYLEQYHQAANALAVRAKRLASKAPVLVEARLLLEARLQEGRAAFWREVLATADAELEARPLEETRLCIRSWAGTEGLHTYQTLAAGLAAIQEAEVVRWSRARAGLVTVLDLCEPEAEALREMLVTQFMGLRSLRRVLAYLQRGARPLDLRSEVESVLASGWLMLDGIQRATEA
jgi:hypothetical protein